MLFAFQRIRPPGVDFDQLIRLGAGKALGKGVGIGLSVVEGGVLRVGKGRII